jgi:predicted nucleic-acid-binding Zn-ribbon protein
MDPRWVVSCPDCKEEFTHTEIRAIVSGLSRDPFASPPKPTIPEDGTELQCRNCGKTSTYKASDLRYRIS